MSFAATKQVILDFQKRNNSRKVKGADILGTDL